MKIIKKTIFGLLNFFLTCWTFSVIAFKDFSNVMLSLNVDWSLVEKIIRKSNKTTIKQITASISTFNCKHIFSWDTFKTHKSWVHRRTFVFCYQYIEKMQIKFYCISREIEELHENIALLFRKQFLSILKVQSSV